MTTMSYRPVGTLSMLVLLATLSVGFPITSMQKSISIADSVKERDIRQWLSKEHPRVQKMGSLFANRLPTNDHVLTSLKMKKHYCRANPKPRGLSFDPCKFHKDCKDPRLCVGPNLDAACSGRANCFCLQAETQLCKSCKECINYPCESCLKNQGEKTTEGLCGSIYTVWEGITTEIGCKSFPNA